MTLKKLNRQRDGLVQQLEQAEDKLDALNDEGSDTRKQARIIAALKLQIRRIDAQLGTKKTNRGGLLKNILSTAGSVASSFVSKGAGGLGVVEARRREEAYWQSVFDSVLTNHQRGVSGGIRSKEPYKSVSVV